MARPRFPVLWTLLLIFGIAWLVNELGYYTIDIPWGPVIVVVQHANFAHALDNGLDGISHVEDTFPTDRHLVVFTFKVLRSYLKTIGFKCVTAKAFGVYPFPKFMQPLLEKIDPWHCHQMLFTCQK